MKTEFAVSLMCADNLRLKKQLDVLNERTNLYHIDIMDGHFCKSITLSPDYVRAVRSATTLPIDVHLMTTRPGDWIETVAMAGASCISPHAEAINTDAFRVLDTIEKLGCKTGVVLNPATSLEAIRHYCGRLDLLTIMTVDVGFAGQRFIPEMLDKVREAVQLRERHGYRYKIQIDGSCNEGTYQRLHQAGADILVVGSSGLFGLDAQLTVAYEKMLAEFGAAIKAGGSKV